MPVVPNDLVGIESSPQADELWALAYLLSADWGEDVIVSTAFQTDVTTHHRDSEQRFGLINRGTRTVEVSAASFDYDDLLKLQSLLIRQSVARSLFPLVPDFSTLTANAAIGTTTINCSTSNKRFFQGGRIVIVDSDYTHFSVREIASLTGSSISFVDALDAGFSVGAEVMPLIEAKLSLQSSMSVRTDKTILCRLSAQELPGPHTVGPLQQPGTIPSGFTAYKTYPIFDLKMNLREDAKFDLVRTGSFSGSGVSQVASVYGSRPRGIRSGLLSFFDRASAFGWIKLFESRAGRLFPFWAVSQTSDFQFSSFGSGTLVVKAVGTLIDWSFHPWVAVVSTAGVVEIREVLSASRSGSLDTLSLDSDFTIPANNIDRVCVAQLSRFRSDEMQERWASDTVMESAFDCIEMPAESDVEIEDVRDPDTEGIPERFNILACQQSIEDGDADDGGGSYDCGDCIMTYCNGDPIFEDPEGGYYGCEGTDCCNSGTIFYNGEFRQPTYFDGTEYDLGVPGAIDLGAWCGCRNTFISTGQPCPHDLPDQPGHLMLERYWLCFELGDVLDETVSYCCCPNDGSAGCLAEA